MGIVLYQTADGAVLFYPEGMPEEEAIERTYPVCIKAP